MRVIQVLDALDFGDGVGNDVLRLQELLTELGIKNQIYSKWWDERVKKYTTDIVHYHPQAEDLVLFHFSGKSYILDQVKRYPCPCVVRYHNITPPEFFLFDNPQAYIACTEGIQQIQDNIHFFDGFWADSAFNGKDLIRYGARRDAVNILPIVVDYQQMKEFSYNRKLLEQLQQDGPYVISVGRVAPNKKQEDILDVFENYFRYHDRQIKLYLIGNTDQSNTYMQKLLHKLEYMSGKERVVFTGKISEKDLYTYYRGASAFICMSEHEGFCIPLLEAQYFDVPVIGYDSCAVPDTMGKSGVLIHKKNPALTACILDSVLHDMKLRSLILKNQRENILKYQKETIKKKLKELLKRWR